MRKDLLLLLKEKEFAPRSEYRSGQYPVEVAVTCSAPACWMVEVINVTTHLHNGPGLWVCRSCAHEYGRKYVEGLLVEHVDALIAAWQAQDLTCVKCKATK